METASKLSTALLPKCPGLRIENLAIDADTVSLSVASTWLSAACPVYGNISGKLRSHYLRTVTDLPWGNHCVLLSLRVRRFRCSDPRCPRKIFAERLPSVVESYARKTTRLQEILLLVGFALGGEAGARLVKRLDMKISPSTLLRRLHGAQTRSFPLPEVIGVDDFALLKGRKYGTIVVDLERYRPIELLEDRSAETLAAWLKQYPKLRIISRDRSTEYERAVKYGAPQVVEVLDRWHLLKNLRRVRSVSWRATTQPSPRSRCPRRAVTLARRTLTWSILRLRAPRRRKLQASLYRKRRLTRYEKVRKLHEQGMIRYREAGGFGGWLEESLSCGVKGFETFAMGLQREQPAVEEAALRLLYSNGQTEGQVNRLKMIKRQMYGRASFGLLRRRFLGVA